MEKITIEIDGKKIQASPETTILQNAREAGIEIPTLCNEARLAPYGGCRICMVEITRNKRSRLVASCVYPVEEGLIVKTDTEKVNKIRRTLLELILPLSPTGPVLALAEKYGLKGSRFTAEETSCILCGLCVRYCAEVKKANAIGFTGRGISREVCFIPENASRSCASCRECFDLCPSGKVAKITDGSSFPSLPWDKN
jgi:NADH dehydrogenase/NADH:ubiquinone oxidoreductase subunit G